MRSRTNQPMINLIAECFGHVDLRQLHIKVKAYVAETSCNQLLLINWFCYVHAHQDLFASRHNVCSNEPLQSHPLRQCSVGMKLLILTRLLSSSMDDATWTATHTHTHGHMLLLHPLSLCVWHRLLDSFLWPLWHGLFPLGGSSGSHKELQASAVTWSGQDCQRH